MVASGRIIKGKKKKKVKSVPSERPQSRSRNVTSIREIYQISTRETQQRQEMLPVSGENVAKSFFFVSSSSSSLFIHSLMYKKMLGKYCISFLRYAALVLQKLGKTKTNPKKKKKKKKEEPSQKQTQNVLPQSLLIFDFHHTQTTRHRLTKRKKEKRRLNC